MKKRGPPPFQPTDAMRNVVSMLVGVKMSWDEIRQLILNPTTGEPISKTCLSRHFKRELAEGSSKIKALIAEKYFAALERDEPWAVRLGMKNRHGWALEGAAPLPDPGGFDGGEIKIRFVMPSKPVEPVDLNPRPPSPQPSPYEGAQPDLSKPALEPPRSRSVDPGHGLGPWRVDPDPKGWMK
jgi:hypothetical protein